MMRKRIHRPREQKRVTSLIAAKPAPDSGSGPERAAITLAIATAITTMVTEVVKKIVEVVWPDIVRCAEAAFDALGALLHNF